MQAKNIYVAFCTFHRLKFVAADELQSKYRAVTIRMYFSV